MSLASLLQPSCSLHSHTFRFYAGERETTNLLSYSKSFLPRSSQSINTGYKDQWCTKIRLPSRKSVYIQEQGMASTVLWEFKSPYTISITFSCTSTLAGAYLVRNLKQFSKSRRGIGRDKGLHFPLQSIKCGSVSAIDMEN